DLAHPEREGPLDHVGAKRPETALHAHFELVRAADKLHFECAHLLPERGLALPHAVDKPHFECTHLLPERGLALPHAVDEPHFECAHVFAQRRFHPAETLEYFAVAVHRGHPPRRTHPAPASLIAA